MNIKAKMLLKEKAWNYEEALAFLRTWRIRNSKESFF